MLFWGFIGEYYVLKGRVSFLRLGISIYKAKMLFYFDFSFFMCFIIEEYRIFNAPLSLIIKIKGGFREREPLQKACRSRYFWHYVKYHLKVRLNLNYAFLFEFKPVKLTHYINKKNIIYFLLVWNF